MLRKKYLWPLLYGILLIFFTAYVLLDTFVIPRAYTQEISEETDLSEETEPSDTPKDIQAPIVTANSYTDAFMNIFISEYREYDTAIYVADIQLSSAEYLKTAFAEDSYGKNITDKTSSIAREHNAILAINGDYYGVQEKGYVLRNGTLYRSVASRNREDLIVFTDGSFSIVKEAEATADTLLANGAMQILSFGPALLIDSTISVTTDEEVGKAKTSNPRTAIGILGDLHYLFVVSDGRTTESRGLSLYELAEFMQSLGASTAYNLDGGGSSTMYFNGKVINKPTTNGKSIKERSVSDIVYIGY